MSNLIEKVEWNMPNQKIKEQLYVYGEADVTANLAMQEPLKKLYQYQQLLQKVDIKLLELYEQLEHHFDNAMESTAIEAQIKILKEIKSEIINFC